jgi:hypothetical protein
MKHDLLQAESDSLFAELNRPMTSQPRRWAIGERLAAIGDRRPGVGLITVPLPPLSAEEMGPGTLRPWGKECAGLPDIVWPPAGCPSSYTHGERIGIATGPTPGKVARTGPLQLPCIHKEHHQVGRST